MVRVRRPALNTRHSAGLLGAVLLGLAAQLAAPAVRDSAYPGALRIEVDARDIERRVFRVRQRIPVSRPGPLTLLYPKWLPGNHAPTGPVEALAGLTIQVERADGAGTTLPWSRDALDMHSFRVDVPRGVAALEVSLQSVTPGPGDSARRVATPALLGVQWEKALLYPAGYAAGRIQVQPSVILPAGWSQASALTVKSRQGDRVEFEPVSLERFVDSPLFAGPYYRQITLDAGAAPVYLNVFADRESQLAATTPQIDAHKRLVSEAVALFGSRQYRRYDFLLALSDTFSGIGLEHHQSSENGVSAEYFLDWDGTAETRDLLPHEFVHSWNGKYRRPADLWTPNYNLPMRNSLLWVYEGLTQYWGVVLAARSGLWSAEFARDALAYKTAVFAGQRPGRGWRPLQDTTQQPIIAYQRPGPYPTWQRTTDYYDEGLLLWLEADTRIRERSNGARSLDDLARRFFAGRDGDLGPVRYTFDDLIGTLEAIEPLDWRANLRGLLDGAEGAGASAERELAATGWKLAWRDKPSPYVTSLEKGRKYAQLAFSLGLTVANENARVSAVVWGSPAFEAGIAPGTTLIGVDGRVYSAALLREVVATSGARTSPIEMIVRDGDRLRTVRVEYRGGARYPVLERLEGRPDRLGALLAPRNKS
jgi:predicted metalloprotease with PDZ domain